MKFFHISLKIAVILMLGKMLGPFAWKGFLGLRLCYGYALWFAERRKG